MSSTSIHIILCFDDNFWAPAFAVMRGICLASHRRGDLVFHLCESGLTAEHRADLERIETEFQATLVFYDLATNADFQTRCANLPRNARLNQIMYARLLVEVLIPDDIERIIYFDCDTLVHAPIEELAEMDMGGKPIAAVRDALYPFVTHGRDIMVNRDLFDTADPYFNSGMLVIDMNKWREVKVLDHLERMTRDGIMNRIYYDQDFLNLVFRNNWLELDWRWNCIDPRLAHQALSPKMVHYTGRNRPWNLISTVAFRRLYRHIMTNELFYRYFRHRLKRRLRRWLRLG